MPSIPIHVSSQWTRTLDTVSVQINYRFNSSTFPDSIRIVNDVVIFSTTIPDGQQLSQSLPTAEWNSDERKLSWKVPYIFDGTGTLSASVSAVQASADANESEQTQQPLNTASLVHVQFLGENGLFSCIDFDFTCRGYRVSLLKKKICSGTFARGRTS